MLIDTNEILDRIYDVLMPDPSCFGHKVEMYDVVCAIEKILRQLEKEEVDKIAEYNNQPITKQE